MQSKDDIFAALKNILVEQFELEPSKIHLDSRLYEDLDLDSIDAIDMILQLQNLAGRTITSAEFKGVKLVRDAVDVLYQQLND